MSDVIERSRWPFEVSLPLRSQQPIETPQVKVAYQDSPGGAAMRDDLYETDFHAWALEQAELLRAHLTGIDFEHIAEELEGLGRERLDSVWSHLVNALEHILKVTAWPGARDVEHWRAEVENCRNRARRKYAASMRQQLDVNEIFAKARRQVPRTMYGIRPEQRLPERSPFSLEQLLGEDDLPF